MGEWLLVKVLFKVSDSRLSRPSALISSTPNPSVGWYHQHARAREASKHATGKIHVTFKNQNCHLLVLELIIRWRHTHQCHLVTTFWDNYPMLASYMLCPRIYILIYTLIYTPVILPQVNHSHNTLIQLSEKSCYEVYLISWIILPTKMVSITITHYFKCFIPYYLLRVNVGLVSSPGLMDIPSEFITIPIL